MFDGIFPTLVAIVILVGILYLAYIASRFLGGATTRQNTSKHMKLLDIMAMGQDKAIAAVKVGDRQFLLGITQGGISNLAELSEAEVEDMLADQQEEPVMQQKFKDVFNKLNKR